jgi:hypothetical protein
MQPSSGSNSDENCAAGVMSATRSRPQSVPLPHASASAQQFAWMQRSHLGASSSERPHALPCVPPSAWLSSV